MSSGIVWMYNPDGHKIRFPWHSDIYEESWGNFWGLSSRQIFCTNEREYPLRLDTSQSHFKWWLAARQEMLSSSKYFLNTTKYLYKSPLPWFLRSEDLSTERPAQRHSGHQAAQCSWCRVSVPSAPVWHAAGPGLAPTGHMRHRAMSVEEPSSHQSSSGHWAVQSVEWPRVLTSPRDIGNPSYRVHMRLREATARGVNCELELLHIMWSDIR